MTLAWYGHFCFRIATRGAVVLFDPYQSGKGFSLPTPSELGADIVISSHPSSLLAGALEAAGKNAFRVTTAGEYDVKEVFITGIPTPEGVILFRIEAEGVSLGHLSTLSRPLSEAELEHLTDVEVLLVGIGGNEGRGSAKTAVETVRKLEPALVVPMGYKVPARGNPFESVQAFVREFGGKAREEERLKISRKDLASEGMNLVLLAPVR